MKIFELFEYLCLELIIDNLNIEYKSIIEINEQKKIKDYYLNNKNGKILSSKNFVDAIRKLISRYLSGKRSENEINEQKDLKLYIVMEELWDTDIGNDENLNNAIENFFKEFKINIGKSFSLFNCLSKAK